MVLAEGISLDLLHLSTIPLKIRPDTTVLFSTSTQMRPKEKADWQPDVLSHFGQLLPL